MTQQASLFSPILASIRTVAELDQVSELIHSLLANLYKLDQQTTYASLYQIRNEAIAKEIESVMTSQHITFSDPEIVRAFLEQLQEALNTCQILNMTIAFEPTDESISKFSSWLTIQVGENIILEITVSKQIVGGAIIIYKGKHRDFSMREKLNQVFEKHRDNIMKLLL